MLQGLTTTTDNLTGRFILIIGEPFSGKTTSALTFPNPVVLNFDNKVPKGTQVIPFHDDKFVDSLYPRANPALPANRRDAFLKWLGANIGKLDASQTLILDSLTTLDTAFHMQTENVENAGAKNKFEVWTIKLKYMNTIIQLLKNAASNVVLIAHTQPEYDEAGNPTGKVKPLIGGSFADKIGAFCTDMFRQVVTTDAATKRRVYQWKIKPDRVFNSNTFLNLPADREVIPADYREFKKLAEQYSN